MDRGLNFVRYADDCIITVGSEMSAKSVEKFTKRMKELTCQNWSVSNSYKIEKLNQLIRGWINYFKIVRWKWFVTEQVWQYRMPEYSYNTSDINTINEKFDNNEKVEDYTECVDASWSRNNHEKTVTYAYNNTGGCITASQVEIVKLGARAPDELWPANEKPQFHAKDNSNYIKVYEHLMNMAFKCKKNNLCKCDKNCLS